MNSIRSALAVGLLLMWSMVAHATDFTIPQQSIAGADQTIELGELVRLSVTPIKLKPEYLASSSYTWKLLDNGKEKSFEENESGERIFFGAGIRPKSMTVFCICTHLYLVKDNQGNVKEAGTRTNFLSSPVIIGDPQPQPKPDPQPNPPQPDDPGMPQGSLARYAYDLAQGVKADSRAKGAKALADSFKGMAAAANGGTIKNIQEMLQKTKEANDQALATAGLQITDWNDYFDKMQDQLYALFQQKKITTVQDFAAAWTDIATGLSKVK